MGARPTKLINFFHFFFSQISPFSWRNSFESNIHDADSFEFHDLISKVFTHSSNLSIETLHKGNPKRFYTFSSNFTFFSNRAQYRYPFRQACYDFIGKTLINSYDVFLFVIIASPQNFIDHVTIIG